MSNAKPLDQSHVVILNNYIRQHHVLAYQALEKRVGKLTILLSTEMEPDRDWDARWQELDVRIQKNWMYTSKWKHSSGFEEPNFIHVPLDTTRQLKKLKPDIVFSYELGMRTLLSSWFRLWNRHTPLVMVGNMSEHIERERGLLRRMLRSVLKRTVVYCTYNGPSCKRYLQSLGFSDKRLFHVPYCFDLDSAWHGDKTYSGGDKRRLLYCGAISSRKGILEFSRCLRLYFDNSNETSANDPSANDPNANETGANKTKRKVQLVICGTGPLQNEVAACATEGLEIVFRGNCSSEQLTEEYREADICVFPTLADEWGLVPIEAMASGVPVLGSRFAQSMEEICCEGENGWLFSPTDQQEMLGAITKALKSSADELDVMGRAARNSVEHITPERTADQFCEVIQSVCGHEMETSSELIKDVNNAEIKAPVAESSAGV